jgi:thiamine-monophosphate kinase
MTGERMPKLSEVGEGALVRIARRIFGKGGSVLLGIGDDAAVVRVGGRLLALTTDMLVARTSFPEIATPEQMGKKAVAVNFSDLAAVGARPIALLLSIALPADLEVSFARRMMTAIERETRRYGAYVVGGDLDESGEISIAGFAAGLVEGKILSRGGAGPGELVGVTGTLGGAAAGLDAIRRGMGGRFRRLVRSQLEPEVRCEEGVILGKCREVTAAIDISDSFAYNLWQIAEESGVRVVVEKKRIPVDPLVRKYCEVTRADPYDFALFGGEDYELLFTVRPSSLPRLRAMFERAGRRFTLVGRTERGRGVWIEEDGKVRRLPKVGYEHFKHNPQNSRALFFGGGG